MMDFSKFGTVVAIMFVFWLVIGVLVGAGAVWWFGW